YQDKTPEMMQMGGGQQSHMDPIWRDTAPSQDMTSGGVAGWKDYGTQALIDKENTGEVMAWTAGGLSSSTTAVRSTSLRGKTAASTFTVFVDEPSDSTSTMNNENTTTITTTPIPQQHHQHYQ